MIYIYGIDWMGYFVSGDDDYERVGIYEQLKAMQRGLTE